MALGALTAMGCILNFVNIAPGLENQMQDKLAFSIMRDRLAQAVPPNQGNVLFVDEGVGNYLDSLGGYHLLDLSLFRPNTFQNLKALARCGKERRSLPPAAPRAHLP